MTSELIVGISGVIGAAVGAGATLIANWIAAHTQLKLAAGNREQQKAAVRRDACAALLVAVDSFMDQARELVSRLENDIPGPECNAAHATYFAGWEDLQRRCAPVLIAGPNELKERAEELKEQLAGLADECDDWYEAHKSGPTRSRDRTIVNLRQSARVARDAFILAAQRYSD